MSGPGALSSRCQWIGGGFGLRGTDGSRWYGRAIPCQDPLTLPTPLGILVSMEITAKDIHTAMVNLRTGKITPAKFREIMRTSREQHGEAGHDALKFKATVSFNKA